MGFLHCLPTFFATISEWDTSKISLSFSALNWQKSVIRWKTLIHAYSFSKSLHAQNRRKNVKEQTFAQTSCLYLFCFNCRSLLNQRKAATWPIVLVPSVTWSALPRPRRVLGKCLKWLQGQRCKSGRGKRGVVAWSCEVLQKHLSRNIMAFNSPRKNIWFVTKQHLCTVLFITYASKRTKTDSNIGWHKICLYVLFACNTCYTVRFAPD